MKLRRIRIERLPGIDAPFEFEAAGDGFHVVYGPNGIGKSSICRAVEALLWSERGPNQRVSLIGQFELDGDRWQCEREGSRVRWQRNGSDSSPPNLPPPHLHHCFFLRLRDLIDPSTDTNDVAIEIQRQMSGGFNLPHIVSDRFDNVKPRAAAGIRREFDLMSQAVLAAQNKQITLQSEADQVVNLDADLDQAESDERRLADVKTAKALAQRRSQLDELSRQVSTLPKSLGKLIGDERQRVEADQAKLESLNERRISLARDLEEAQRDKTESALEVPIESTQLATWRKWRTDLQRIELESGKLGEDHRGFSDKLRAALEAVGGSDIKEVELDLEDHGQVFEFLRMAQTHETKTSAIEERIRLLANIESTDESQKILDQFTDGANALRAWLRAPDPGPTQKTPSHHRFWIIGAALLIVAGVTLALTVHPGLALIAGIGGGIVLALLMWRSSRFDPDGRLLAKADFEKLDLEGPKAWDLHEVTARLRELEHQIAELEAKKTRARDRDVETKDLENKLEGLSDYSQKIETRRRSLLESLNLNEIRGDAELVDLVRAFDQLRQARIDERNAAGKVDANKEQYDSVLSELAKILEDNGQMKADDAAAAIAGIDQLTERDLQLQTALSTERRLLGEIENIDGEIVVVNGTIAKIFSNLDLERDDVHGLASLIEQHPTFLALRDKSADLKTKIELECEQLAAVGEEALADTDEAKLDQLEIELTKSADSVSELRDRIANVNAAVRAAKEAHDVELLIEKRDAVVARLEEQFDDELFERVGRLLVHEVEREHEQIQMPRVLERASQLFSAFTHHSYELQLGSNANDARLIAIDLRTGHERELAELSDGTRTQLLLAARLAFAEEVERGNLLPLFLDEALDQSDPTRYYEMVKTLGRVVEDQGRQIFYFTNDPVDLDRIQAALAEEGCGDAQSTDLGLVRHQAEGVVEPLTLRIEPRTQIPSPANQSAEDYAITIGVRPLDPRRGSSDQHLFHLLWDDLNLLRALLEAGVKWVGQWRSFSGSNLAAKLRTEFASADELDFRSDLFVVFCELWNQGHGQPIDRDAIEESGAIGERFLDHIITIAAEKHGDGNQLIETLRARDDERLKGFREKSTERLEQYFRETGYIDDRPVLSEEELLPLAMASPAAAQLPAGVPGRCVSRWWALAILANEL